MAWFTDFRLRNGILRMALLLGYDVGSSSIKATLMEAETGKVLAAAVSPAKELEIIAKKDGWAEQHPQIWWLGLQEPH